MLKIFIMLSDVYYHKTNLLLNCNNKVCSKFITILLEIQQYHFLLSYNIIRFSKSCNNN